MPRIRTIKPEFWSSPGIEELEPRWRLLYIAMWQWADDFGRGTAEPRELAAFAFPREDISVGEIRRGLGGIRRTFDVDFYYVARRPFYSIPSWSLHQKVDARSKRSRYPAPEDGEPFDPLNGQVIGHSAASSADPAGVSADPAGVSADSTPWNRGTGEQGNRDTHTPSNADRELDDAANRGGAPGGACSAEPSDRDRKRRSRYSTRFEEWYQHWPRKVGKREAARAFDAALKRVGFDELVDATKRHAEAWRQAGTETRFIPHPATWLRRDGWDDELDAPKNAREGASRGSSDGSRPSDWLGGFDASGGDLGPFVIDQPPLDERSDP